jgi:hypothetical protein
MSLIITRGFGFMGYDDSVTVRTGFEDEDVITTNVRNVIDDNIGVSLADDEVAITTGVINVNIDIGE